jgi:pyrimidine-specific ribonucleoside hydrolase
MFDYNYELDFQINGYRFTIGYTTTFLQADKFLYIGNISLASLDQNEEADKWLFIVQPWMKTRSFWVRGFIPLIAHIGGYTSRLFYLLQRYSYSSKL